MVENEYTSLKVAAVIQLVATPISYPVNVVICIYLEVHMQLVNNPQNGLEAGDVTVTVASDNAAAGLTISSQAGSLSRELKVMQKSWSPSTERNGTLLWAAACTMCFFRFP